ncbi:hypothetical protein UNSWCS_462 [Campylobacter concisus UNSWCS]|uniref:Uncharacterized protein n=1 Tax=Campylobacter concisus UNSWCS TaxID=1242968 RepID=U2EUL5_9BACT|nr:hypothetical protein UNSWCS_462 [Campylobacter concisus UNSWCS]
MFLASHINFALRICKFKGKWQIKFMLLRSNLKFYNLLPIKFIL